MSTHSSVSCDACMISNFPGRRYKCLLCVNYDLCGTCYDARAENQNHKSTHPMQCILTEVAAELFYGGETTTRRCASSLTCPYCAQTGFTTRTLLNHCIEKHSTPSTQGKADQVVMCPICVTSQTHRTRPRFGLLADHIATVHDDGTLGNGGGGGGGGGDEYIFTSAFGTQPQRNADEEEESDDEEAEDDEDGGLLLNDLEQRALAESERRQDVARQRLVNASSLAAVVLNSSSNNSNTQRRPLSRQTAIRIARGSFRSHFNNFPYGSSSRGGGGGNTSSRNATDSNTTALPPQASLYDPFASTLGVDPMLDYVSQLMANQQTSTSGGQWSFLSPYPVQPTPSSSGTNVVDYVRLQQQLDGTENTAQTTNFRQALLNAKQKRTSQNQQQTSTDQPVTSGNTSGQEFQTWQQQLSSLQRAMNLVHVLGDHLPSESSPNSNSSVNPNLRNVQTSTRDIGTQSLLEKMLKCELNVNKDETTDSARTQRQQDRLGLLRSVFLSFMTNSLTDDKDENQSKLNKENQL